jgi:hypothetical protein
MLALFTWMALLLFLMEVLHFHRWGKIWYYSYMGVSLLAILYLFEAPLLLDRRAFTCKRCGYDLTGLSEPRCPECGTDFDPDERERILARINAPAPKPRYKLIAMIVIVVLSMALAAGFVVWQRTAGTAPANTAAPAPASTNP